jgi:hypothetical protein
MLYFGELRGPLPGKRLNTLDNMFVELHSGLTLVVDRPGSLFSFQDDGNPYLEFVRNRRASWPSDPSVPERYRPLLELGLLVTRLDIAYEVGHVATARLESEMRSAFPVNLLEDQDADWSRWAGSPKLNPVRWRADAEPPE